MHERRNNMIKVTVGTVGIFENNRMMTKTKKDPPFKLSDEKEKHLVDRGVAKYVNLDENPAKDPVEDPEEEPEEDPTAHLDAAELEGWDYSELKKLAAEMGIEPKGRKKSDYVEALAAAEIIPGDEDDMPTLEAADPVGGDT
jgi:hypothetical protein